MLILIMICDGDYSTALKQKLATHANSNFNATRGRAGVKQNNYPVIASQFRVFSSSVMWLSSRAYLGKGNLCCLLLAQLNAHTAMPQHVYQRIKAEFVNFAFQQIILAWVESHQTGQRLHLQSRHHSRFLSVISARKRDRASSTSS